MLYGRVAEMSEVDGLLARARGTRPVTPPGRVQAAFERQIRRLPQATQALLVAAAAEDRGDLAVV